MSEPVVKSSHGSRGGPAVPALNGHGDSPLGNGKARQSPVIVKKYANRRLYNTETSTYVTLDDLGTMVRSDRDFLVYDAKTGEELTHSVLTQIIVEEEGKNGQNLLPISFLRQLIRFYGHSLEELVPQYLELSMETLTREHEKYRKQFTETFGVVTLEALQEQARQNIALFERAVSMFTPFAKMDKPGTSAEKRAVEDKSPASSEIADLKAQLALMQAQLDRLAQRDDPKDGK